MKKKIRKLFNEHLGNISKKGGLKIPYFIFTISIILTMAVAYFFYSNAKTIDSKRFASDVLKVKAVIKSRLDTYISILRAGRGYISASDNVNRDRFREFTENLRLKNNYPGVQAIGFVKFFTAPEKEAVEKQMRSEGFPDFTVKPDTPRNEYQSIIYIEPFNERNKKAHGFDMSSEATRKLALDTARDTGNYTISGKVVLIQDELKPQPGFIIFAALYKGNKTPETVEERRKQLDGFVFGAFQAFEFTTEVINDLKTSEIAFKIYDNEVNEANLLAIGNDEQSLFISDLKEQNEIDVGGRKWIVTYTALEKFKANSLTWWTPIIFLLGLATSVILFFLSLSQSRANIKLSQIAKDLAQSETEVQKLLESEQNAREIAEKSNKVKDEFISIISHEMRTPLNSISGWVQILKSDSLPQITKDRAISKINKNLRSQVSLVDEMIDFSDTTSFQKQDKWEQKSFTELVETCLGEINNQFVNRQLNLTKEFGEQDFYIFCDKEKVKKAVLHLLNNALKFTPKDGLITVNLSLKDSVGELKITDTGEGISSENLSDIFNVFNQLDASTTRKYGGLGLSLAIVKKIVEGHSGKIIAESEGLGKGSTFTVTLPVSKN